MKICVLIILFACAAQAAEKARVSDREIWNEAVDYYDAGDVTNALKNLNHLMSYSKAYRARAAEVVAKIEYDQGHQETAAIAAQIALQGAPNDAKANRNFTRAIDGLPEAREAKHINEVLKAMEKQDPGSIMEGAVQEARELMMASAGYTTNVATRAVARGDSLAARARALADKWIPVKDAICQSVTNQEQAATIVAQVEEAQKKTKSAATKLEDLDAVGAWELLSDVEHDYTRFHKLMVMPPGAIAADLTAQSNAWMDVDDFNGRTWQQDALDYTRAFRAKFPAWAKQYEQQAQADTNRAPFTAEDQAKISALATELEKAQLECVEKSLPPKQEEALELLRQIQELLPKDKNGGGQSQNQSNQNQQSQGQKNQDQKNEQQNQNDSSNQTQDQDPNEQNNEQQEDEKSAAEGEEDEKENQEIDAILKKAQERNDEHEADKKARMRKVPLPPNERDW